MGIFPRLNQRSKVLLPIRTNLSEYNEIPELTTISSNTSIPSVQDGPTVVQRYRSLTIGVGATLTTQYRCCGLVLIVDGDLTVNGTISMTARGAHFQPNGDHRIKNELLPAKDVVYEIDIPATADEIADFLKREKRRYHSLDELPAIYRPTLYCRGPRGSVYAPADLGVIPAVGGAGGGSAVAAGGNAGAVGTGRRCGGGGSGASVGSNTYSGAGAAGTCYSGGSGGGAAAYVNAYAGSLYGGAGGAANGDRSSPSGGAGNPGGAGWSSGVAGSNGTGGRLIIICTGKIIVGSAGAISANGCSGGGGSYGGGGSGGGAIDIFYGSLENNGSIAVVGGPGGTGINATGGKGGDGCVTLDHYNF